MASYYFSASVSIPSLEPMLSKAYGTHSNFLTTAQVSKQACIATVSPLNVI